MRAKMAEALREHPLEASHLPGCLSLSAEAGWNQVEADWQLMLRLGRGWGVSGADGSLVASTIVLPYENRFAWISMVLVTERFRRQGIATRLMQRAVAELLAAGMIPLLDATPAGREVYRRLGFQDCWPMTRFHSAPAVASANWIPGEGPRVRRIRAGDWAGVLELDRAVFGADRAGVLCDLANRLPQAALIANRNGHLCGACFARDGRLATQIGPVVAEDGLSARALIAGATAAITFPAVIDVADRHPGIAAWLRDMGFTPQRSLLRMAHGPDLDFSDRERLIAVAGPELG